MKRFFSIILVRLSDSSRAAPPLAEYSDLEEEAASLKKCQIPNDFQNLLTQSSHGSEMSTYYLSAHPRRGTALETIS